MTDAAQQVWPLYVVAGSTDPRKVALEAARLEEAIDEIESGAFAKKRAPGGERVRRRPAIVDAEERLREFRIGIVEFTLHTDGDPRCVTRLESGALWPRHEPSFHRKTAVRVVSALFPPGQVVS